MSNKIYIFARTDHQSLGFTYQALAEDGTPLGTHISSNDEWAMHDMRMHSEDFDKHYPDGWELELVTSFNEIEALYELNRKKYGELTFDHPNNARITVKYEDDDGKQFTKVIE